MKTRICRFVTNEAGPKTALPFLHLLNGNLQLIFQVASADSVGGVSNRRSYLFLQNHPQSTG
jgi:hypothetical protein